MDALSAGGEAQDQREFSKARQPEAASPGGAFPHIEQRAQLELTQSYCSTRTSSGRDGRQGVQDSYADSAAGYRRAH